MSLPCNHASSLPLVSNLLGGDSSTETFSLLVCYFPLVLVKENFSFTFSSLVLAMKKFDCLEVRSAAIPDRSDKGTGQALTKFTDYVSVKFDCPRIVINGKLH